VTAYKVSSETDAGECFETPQAKAYSLLKELDLGFSLDEQGKKAGRIEFIEGRAAPGAGSSCETILQWLFCKPRSWNEIFLSR
jgi:hypothetical protein